MMAASKILCSSALVERGQICTEARSMVLCFGHFNVIHPGHLRFLQHAKAQGEILVVVIQGDEQLRSERAKYYSQQERAEGVAALQAVDNVVILDQRSLSELVATICPEVLVLGKEFEQERYQQIRSAIEMVGARGGRTIFHAGEIHYASGELLHSTQDEITSERRRQYRQACAKHHISPSLLVNSTARFDGARILVLGDTIVDQYVACDPLGMSAEAPVIVVRELESKEFVGGAGVVAAHIAALGATCYYLSVVGDDANAAFVDRDLKARGVSADLIRDESRPTTFKIRYMVENQKLFRVSRLKEHKLSRNIEDRLIDRLGELIPKVDGILVSDFVYGVITPKVLEVVSDLAKRHGAKLFGDLQCSSQVGSVGKFLDFDLICPTEREARIALNNQDDGIEWIANSLLRVTRAKSMLVKLGESGFIAYGDGAAQGGLERQHFPALVANPVDVAGAGDSLIAAMAVALCSGFSLMDASALGAAMAALAVQTVGNTPITREQLGRFINGMEVV